MTRSKAADIDEYIAGFPKATQKVLKQVRSVIRGAAPGAEETISYDIPTFKLAGTNLVHFAAFEHHIGFYPTPVGISVFKKELARYKTGKGSVQFPLDEPMPVELITKMTKFRTKSIGEKQKTRKK